MPREDLGTLMMIFDHMKTQRILHEEPIQEITDLMYPFRGDITTLRSPGDLRVDGVFDTTATIAADGFANLIKSSVAPANTDWLRLEPPDEFADDLDVQQAFDATAARIQKALDQSNFDQEFGIFLRDFSIIGNATLHVQEDKPILRNRRGSTFGGLQFKSVFFTDTWWSHSPNGLETFARKMCMTALHAARFFGEENVGLKAGKHLRRGELMENVDYLHFVYRNQDGIPGGLVPPDQKPWISHWVALNDGKHEELRVRGFNVSPYIVGRWTTVRGEAYGSGIGHLVRPDAAGLNELARQIYIATGRDLNPPIMLEDESTIDLDTGPNGVIVVRPFQKLAPQFLGSGSRHDIADAIRRGDRDQIRDGFMGQLLDEPDSQPRSAEETLARQQRGLVRFAAPADITDNQVMRPMTESVISIMLDAGELPELELLVEEFEEIELRPKFVSPFFTAQKQAPIRRIDEFLQRRFFYFQQSQNPEWLIDIDPRKVTLVDRRLSDVPAEIFKTEEEIEAEQALVAQRAESEEQRANVEAASSAASATNASPEQLLQGVQALQGA